MDPGVRRKALSNVMKLFHQAAAKAEWSDVAPEKPKRTIDKDDDNDTDALTDIIGSVVAKKE